jgi:alpha-tubulin suppressor-like RCC1 family protein
MTMHDALVRGADPGWGLALRTRRFVALLRPALLALAAGLSWVLAPSEAAAQTEDVTWRAAVGVTVSGNDLTKTTATAWGNSGASSLQGLESNGFVEFTAGGTAMLGLSKGDTDQNYPDIDFAVFIWSGTLYVYEFGSSRGSFGTAAPSDTFRVEVANGVVRYRKNGAVFYTSTLAARFPLLVDVALYSTGATLTDVRIGQTSFSGDAGVTVSGQTLTKTAATGWNAGAVCARRIPWGDGFAEFSAVETDKKRAAGLSNGDTDKTAADIDFAVVLNADATVEVQEAGVSRGSFGFYAAGDRFRVEVQDGAVTYLKNGLLLYSSGVAPVYPLWADTALHDAGATLSDMVVSELVWTTASGVTISAGSLTKTGSSGWNAGAASTASLAAGDGFVEFTATETNTTRACGLADQDTSYDPAEIDFAVQLQGNADVRVYESGTLRGTFGSYAPGDRFRVEVQLGQVVYRKNGAVFYTSSLDPVYPLKLDATLDTPGATLGEVRLGSLVWKNEAGVAVWGYGLLDTAATGWGNSGAATTVELVSGDGAVEYTATDTSSYRMLGLSNGDTDRNFTDIDFALYAGGGTVYVYQKGTAIGSYGAYAVGDRLRVAVEGGVVKYRRNGALLYTSSQAIQYPLLVDSALYTSGAAMTDIVLTGNFVPGSLILPAPGLSPGSSTYNTPQNVTVSCAVTGTTVRYTTNGQDPTQSDPVVACGGVVPVDQSLTLKAKGWKSGWLPSAVSAATYTMAVGLPSLSPPPGGYAGAQSVTLSTVTPGATIRYTTNGFDPTPSDPVGTSVNVDHTLTLKARATRTGWTDSAVAGGIYVVTLGTVAAPGLAPAGGSYAGPQAVTVSCATAGATIRYTVDGSEPTFSSPIYTQPITVASSTTLKARAFKLDWLASSVTSGTYSIGSGSAADPPILGPGSGRYANGLRVTVTSPMAGTTIRYTTTGVDPTETDPVVASGATVLVDRSMRLKARAWKAGLAPSPVASADYEIVGAVAAGNYHSVALRADGTVATWGTNSNGQLGDGTTVQRTAPVDVPGLVDVIAVAAGQIHTLALKADGTVWSWGYNGAGEGVLGAGITDPQRTSPVQVLQSSGPLTGVVAIAAGMRHSLALKSDGTVWVWGDGYYGELGLGNQNSQFRAVQVPGLAGVTAIAAGGWHSLVLQTNGATSGVLWGWGQNNAGQLADGTTTTRYSPILIADQVALGAGGVFHTLIRKADGSLWGAGLNDLGQLGNGTTLSPQLTFAPALQGLSGVTKISASGVHTLVLTDQGEAWATGFNGYGPLGDGTIVNKTSPVRVVLLHDVVDIAAGRFNQSIYWVTLTHSVALTADGRVWTWGANSYGALGNGLTINDHRYRPQPIAGFSAADQSWPTGDPDGDGLLTQEELEIGTDPFNPDTNGDGVTDGAAVRSGLSATGLDVDGDGVANTVERVAGTDPLRADTDGDAVADGADCYPLDPTRSVCPQPQPGDVTPPVITLTEPTSAVLLSSVP